MLCIWRGAPDWPEGPPSSGDSSSIQPTRGLHDCFQPDARSLPATRGLAQVCGGEPARPRRRRRRGAPPGPARTGTHPRSVWRLGRLQPTGWGRGAGGGLGEGRGASGGGPGGMKLLQTLPRGRPAARSLRSARQAGRGSSARQGSCLSCVSAVGGAWGPGEGGWCEPGWGRGWEEEGTTREREGLALLESGAVAAAQKIKTLLASCARWQRGVWETRWAGPTGTCARARAMPPVAGSPWASRPTSLSLRCKERAADSGMLTVRRCPHRCGGNPQRRGPGAFGEDWAGVLGETANDLRVRPPPGQLCALPWSCQPPAEPTLFMESPMQWSPGDGLRQ